jgi:hypothetical protein
MKLILLVVLGIPFFWLVALLYYLLTWIDWDKARARIDK